MTSAGDAASSDRAVSRLSPGDERGGTLLVCGGSAAARRARLDAIVAQLGEPRGAPPVIVRVTPRPGELSLGDCIAATAEGELTRLGAPGGLYDDPSGGALASLGGWLFRARAIRRQGVVLVLDEVESWIDARGATPGESPALAVVRRVLDECAKRPFSLVASVRASDASGAPALPTDIAQAFAETERLGGAPTVTRDPMQIVTQLAGRSFTLGALRNALAGWLEVPSPADDTVVVFTSPLGPPALGHEPEAEVTFPTRATNDAAPVAPPRAKAVEPPIGEGWGDAVKAAVTVRDSLRTMRGLDAKRGARQWERLFWDGASRLANAVTALEKGERALGIEPTRLATRGRDTLTRFDRYFREYYAHSYDAWIAGTTRPTMLCDLPAKVTKLATERQARGTAFVLVTGLRVDAWHRWRERILPRVPGLTVLEEGLHWAARPATSRVQRELLARGASALGAALPDRDEPPAPRSLDEAVRPRREHLGHHEVMRVDAYALDAAEPSDDGLTAGWDRIERAIAPALLALCGSFAGRTVLAVAGDAGMRETPRGENEHGPRGAMGGDSPFEVLTPYALLGWGFPA